MRPESVSNEDISRWDNIIDNDALVPEPVKKMAVIREVMYAGMWLAESLLSLGCPPEIAARIQFTAGSLSFGHEPWAVHQEVLDAYKNNQLEFEIDYDA